MKSCFIIILTFCCYFTNSQDIFIPPSKLNWDNFKGVPNKPYIAYTWSKPNFEIHYNKNGYVKSIKGLVLFCQDSSFVRRERLFELDESKKTALFQHELCHYLLTIVQCKRIMKTITEGGEVNTNSVQEIIDSFRKENKQLNLDYDNDTKHGADIAQQKKWHEWIDKELMSLKSYKIKGE